MNPITILSNFLPWVAFGILNRIFPAYAMLCGIFICFFTYPRLRKGFILEWGTLLFFIIGFLYEIVWKSPSFSQHMYLFSSFFPIMVAGFSLLINKPFTLQYAKLKMEKKYWDHPLFIKINKIMTALFCCIFVAVLCVNIFRHQHPGIINGHLVWIVAFTLEILLIKLFPLWYKARHFRKSYQKKELSHENFSD
jgi:hypothetical protein